MFKKILVVLILVIGLILFLNQNKNEIKIDSQESINSTNEENLIGVNFSGILEEVNVGCFADAECYVVVDGKHVTAIMGWSQGVAGTIQGVEGFGDLENYIGKEVEVYAQDTGEGKYTLYGSEGFYIRLK